MPLLGKGSSTPPPSSTPIGDIAKPEQGSHGGSKKTKHGLGSKFKSSKAGRTIAKLVKHKHKSSPSAQVAALKQDIKQERQDDTRSLAERTPPNPLPEQTQPSVKPPVPQDRVEEKPGLESQHSVPASIPESDTSDATATTTGATRASSVSDNSDVSELAELEFPDDVDNLDPDAFVEEHISPQVKKASRNAAEQLVGWFAEQVINKHLPVDSELSTEHKHNLDELQGQLAANKKSRERLQSQTKELEKAVRISQGKIKGLQDKLEKLLSDIATKEAKLRTVPHASSDGLRRELAKFRGKKEAKSAQLTEMVNKQSTTEALVQEKKQQIAELAQQASSLFEFQEIERDALAQARKRQKVFNEQIVTLALNLRRIHQGKAALGTIRVPDLKIPVGEGFLDLQKVRFRPADIATRFDDDGQPLVDITLKDIRAYMDLPIEDSVSTDLDVSIDNIKLTLGGPVAKAMQDYLNDSSAKFGINMGRLISESVKLANGKYTEAPVHVGAEIGKVVVNTNGTNVETIARAVAKARRTPSSGLHKLIANLRLPVSATVHELDIHTGHNVELGDPDLNSGNAMKVNARVRELNVDLIPDIEEKMQDDQRHARLAVHAGHAHVNVNSPVGLAIGAVQQLLPEDPLLKLPEPLSDLTDPTLLDRLPKTLSSDIAVDLDNLDVVLDRNVNKRTTLASSKKPVWCVEGDASSEIKADKVVASTVGSVNGAGTLHNLHVRAQAVGDQKTTAVTIAPNVAGETSGQLALNCEPELMTSLAELTEQNKLAKVLVDGQANIAVKGLVDVQLDQTNNAVQVSVDGVAGDVQKAAVAVGDLRVHLPKSVTAKADGLALETSPVQEYRGSKIKRSEVGINALSLDGEGDLFIEQQIGDNNSVGRMFKVPVQGQTTLRNFGLETIQSMSSDGKETRRRMVLHPGQLVMQDLATQGAKVDQVRLQVDDELNGVMKIRGARMSFNELLLENDSVPQLPAPIRWLLKNKTITLDSAIPVRAGTIDLRQASASRLRAVPDQQKASLFDRLTCRIVNVALRFALASTDGRIVHIDQLSNRPVLRSPLFRQMPIPLPERVGQAIAVNGLGTIDLAATQFQATGLYCLPRSRQQELDRMLEQVLIDEQSVPRLDLLITDAERSIGRAATAQEAFYLLNGLPIERLVAMAKTDESMRSVLRRLVVLSLKDERSRSVALEIFNRGLSLQIEPDQEQLQLLLNTFDGKDPHSTDLALLLCKLSRIGLARPLLDEIISQRPNDRRALIQLARIEWGLGQSEQALGHIRNAALSAHGEEFEQITTLLDSWLQGEDDRNSDKALSVRLLQASLLVRDEVFDGHSDQLLKGLKGLEELAQLEDQGPMAEAAVTQLKSRCRQAWQIHEELELEPWEAWQEKVNGALDGLKKGKKLELDQNERYLIGLGLSYGYRGITPHLDYARQMFLSMAPITAEAKVHLQLLNELLLKDETP